MKHPFQMDRLERCLYPRLFLCCLGVWVACPSGAAPYVPGRPETAAPAVIAPRHAAPTAATQTLAPILQHMGASEDPQLRVRAMELWPLSAENESDFARTVAALQDSDDRARLAARDALERAPVQELFAYVMRTLAWGAADQVRLVDAVLPAIGPRLNSLMAATLETEIEAERHRRVAAWVLGRSGNTANATLLSKYALEGQGDLSSTCVQALACLRAQEAFQTWVQLLEKGDNTSRVTALNALAELDMSPARQVLMAVAKGEKGLDRALAQQAVQCVAAWEDGQAIPALVEIMQANPALGACVVRLLRDKTGQNIGEDPKAWRDWMQQGRQNQ